MQRLKVCHTEARSMYKYWHSENNFNLDDDLWQDFILDQKKNNIEIIINDETINDSSSVNTIIESSEYCKGYDIHEPPLEPTKKPIILFG